MTYIRNAWYVGSWSHKLEAGVPLAVQILNDPVVIFRTQSGKVVALADRCSHRLAPLSLGRCEGESIRCMYHGLKFEGDGSCSEIPGQDLIPANSRVRSYPVIERHGWIWVWMGDTDAVDEELIPPIIGPDEGTYLLGKGDIDYQAQAYLIWDNLLDFSHLGYVHPTSFNSTETWGETRPVFTPLPLGVRADRWVLDQPPLFGDQRSDQWFTYDFLVPGILILTTKTFPVGKAEEFGMTTPPDDAAWIQNSYSAHAITPLTDGTARYFFTFGPHADGGTEAGRDAFLELAFTAFAEDQTFIEAQSRIIAQSPGAQIMPTSADKGITLFHRLTDKMIRAERESKLVPAA